jgi:hypothetical protein
LLFFINFLNFVPSKFYTKIFNSKLKIYKINSLIQIQLTAIHCHYSVNDANDTNQRDRVQATSVESEPGKVEGNFCAKIFLHQIQWLIFEQIFHSNPGFIKQLPVAACLKIHHFRLGVQFLEICGIFEVKK